MTTKLKTTCPHCEKRLRIDEAKRGKTVRCPACKESFTVNAAFAASKVTIDTAPAVVSVDTTELSNKETVRNVVSRADQSKDEQTLRKLGRFELKSVLGAGGFGKVYRAYDPQLERFVALKVPTFGPNQKTRIQRFLTEAKAAARLKHANIVTTFESGKADKKYYIASEYIEGDLLSDLTKKERAGVEESARIVRMLAEALAYAHRQGVVHRDIKPHNVMIDNNGEPQLMDFGLAKRSDDSSNLTTEGALLGTPAYMSPEQARGELHIVNASSDQYSLGVVLYHLLTGGTPCEGSPHMVIAEVAKGAFHSVRDWNSSIDRTLDAICQKAMHPEQAQRYTDCDEFAADLDAWANRKFVIARPPTALQQIGRTFVENQVVVILFSMIVLLSVLVAVFAFRATRRNLPIAAVSDSISKPHDAEAGSGTLLRAASSTDSLASEFPEPAVDTTMILDRMAEPIGWQGWPEDAPRPAIAPFDVDQAKQHQDAWARYLGLPVQYENDLGMKFRLIPPGQFSMGSTKEVFEREKTNKLPGGTRWRDDAVGLLSPPHEVYLTEPIYLGIYEVTQREFAAITGNNPSHFSSSGKGKTSVDGGDTSEHPIESMNWADATAFCDKMSSKERLPSFYAQRADGLASHAGKNGMGYRLPTEAQWEFACRAGTTTLYWCGDRDEDLAKVGWFLTNSGRRTHSVGELLPNPFGLFDIHGNVAELTDDQSTLDYKSRRLDAPTINPTLPATQGTLHQARGGCVAEWSWLSRSAFRRSFPDEFSFIVGLRLSLSIESVRQCLN